MNTTTTTTTYENGLKSSESEFVSETTYKPVESIKTFQPLQPFKPFATFETPKPFETLKSFELVKQAEDSFSHSQNSTGQLPEGYEPIRPLSPLKPSDLEPIFTKTQTTFTSNKTTSVSQAEIKEENIKNTLKEIILDLDNFVERDKDFRDEQNTGSHIPTIVVNGGPGYSRSGLVQVSFLLF